MRCVNGRHVILKGLIVICIFLSSASVLQGQDPDTIPIQGSYLYYGQPIIEDNSMLIEEAFNQDIGSMQHISNLSFKNGNLIYSYQQEIPLAGVKHQLSFGVSYASLKGGERLPAGENSFLANGVGDIYINYRPLLWGKNDWALVIPRFTLIIPTGNARYGSGSGGWGGQVNMAVTKRLHPKVITHYNAGYSFINSADYYTYAGDGTPVAKYEKNLPSKNMGASAIWLVRPRFNLMLEFTSTFSTIPQTGRSVDKNNISIISPGFRFAIQIDKVQIVPGLGVPFSFRNGLFDGTGGLIYLSIESGN